MAGRGDGEQPGENVMEGADDVDVDQFLMSVLQSALNDDGGINPEVLTDLSNDFPNIDFAELLQQFRIGQEQQPETNQEDVNPQSIPSPPEIKTESLPLPTNHEEGPQPESPDTELLDLDCDNEVEVTLASPAPPVPEDSITQQASVMIIEADGGITVCHDGSGGDLRPKAPVIPPCPVIQNVPSTSHHQESNPRVEVKVKVEKEEEAPVAPQRHHHHKEKKKDKDRDGDREQEREERRRRQKEKEQAQPSKTVRHPAFVKNRRKFHLLDTSVTVIKLDTLMPNLKKHMRLGRKGLSRIEEMDRKRQTVVNNIAGKIRLVPRPRPAYEFESIQIKPERDRDQQSSSHKRHADGDKKRKDEPKRRKGMILSDSETDSDRKPSKSKLAGGKKTEKDNRKSSKPHGEFSATGARILSFEKPRISRPKMPEPEVKKEKESKKNRPFSTGGSKESERKWQSVLQEAIQGAKAKVAEAQAAQQYKIPKSTQPRESALDQGRFRDRDRDRVTTSTPLQQIRQQGTLQFDQGRKFAPNSYGFHRQNPIVIDDEGEVGGMETWEFERRKVTKVIEMKLLNRAEADDYDDDDNALGMHDDRGSDEDEEEEPVTPRPPAEEVTMGPLAKTVCEMLQRHPIIKYPTMVPVNFSPRPENSKPEASMTAMTIQKCAWWFQTIDKTLIPAILAVPFNPEADDVALPSPDGNESVSSFGHVSNPGGSRQCQINEVSSSQNRGAQADPEDLKDEFCGRTLLQCEFRISGDDKFQKIFDLASGSAYERKYLQATCTICKEEIDGKRELGKHLRSENHRTNFKQISLTVMPNTERSVRKLSEERPANKDKDKEKGKVKVRNGGSTEKDGASKSSSSKEDSSKKSKNKEDSSKKSKTDRAKDNGKVKKEEKVYRVSRAGTGSFDRRSSTSSRNRKSRSRTRSPRRRYRRRRTRSRSRTHSRSPIRRRRSSPRRRSTSAEKVAKFLERTRRSRSRGPHSRSRSPKVRIRKSRKQPSIFSEKLKLQAAGKWTNIHEENWKRMEEEERNLDTEIAILRDALCDRPEEHPTYEVEWQAYWKQTYQEVETAGHNADTFDYVPGWKVQWAKRSEEIMEEIHYEKLGMIRSKYGMDLPSLQRLLLDIPTAPVPPPLPQQEVVLIPIRPPSMQDIYTPFEDDLMARSMSMSGSGHTEPAPPGVCPEPTVTLDTVQKTWEMLTGQKMSGAAATAIPKPSRSDRSAGSAVGSSPMDLDMELIEVLGLMISLEDQLSILAPQVGEYFKRAETMEVLSSRKSYDLLEDKEFVALMFQCRDKFMGLIRANILTHDVLKRMNKAVYGLTSILNLEPCQRLRPKPVNDITTAVEMNTAAVAEPPEVDNAPPNFEILRRPPRSHISNANKGPAPKPPRPLNLSKEGYAVIERIRGAMNEIPIEKRREVAKIINDSLTLKGFPMTDNDLVKYMHSILEPALLKLNWGPILEPVRRPQSPFQLLDQKREPMRGVGTALPVYPEIQCRASSPPRGGMVQQHFQHVRGGGPVMGMGPRQFLNPSGGVRGGRASMSPRGGGRSPSPARIRASLGPRGIPPLIPPLPLPGASLGPRGIPPLIPPLPPRGASLDPRGIPPLPLRGSVSPRSSSPFSPVAHRAQSWSPTPPTTMSSRPPPPPPPLPHLSSPEPQPGPSRSMRNETENIPPELPNQDHHKPDRNRGGSRSGAEHQVKATRKSKEKPGGGIAEVFWSLDGSSVSSESMASSGGMEMEREEHRFKVKKASKSMLSNGSGATRAKLKERNPQGEAPAPPALDDVSEAESGEIISSDDAASVSSSVQNRRRKFRQKLEAMNLVKAQRRQRSKADRNRERELAEWFQVRRRRRDSSHSDAHASVTEKTNGGKSSRRRRTRTGEAQRRSSERNSESSRRKSSKKVKLSPGSRERRDRMSRKALFKRKKKEQRRRVGEEEGRGRDDSSERGSHGGRHSRETERRRSTKRRRRNGDRRRRVLPRPSESQSHHPHVGQSSSKRRRARFYVSDGAESSSQVEQFIQGYNPCVPKKPLRPTPPPRRLSHRDNTPPIQRPQILTAAGIQDEHPPPIPALDLLPPAKDEGGHAYEVVSSISSSPSMSPVSDDDSPGTVVLYSSNEEDGEDRE